MENSHLWLTPSGYSTLAQPNGKHLHWVTEINESLPIFMGNSAACSQAPITLHDLFHSTLKTFSNHRALTYKVNGKWQSWTYQEYYQDSKAFAASLLSLGLADLSTTNIIGFNSPQWLIGFVGSIFAGTIPVGVYTTNNVEACEYVAKHSEAQMVLVQNEFQLKKYLALWPNCPHIKAIVVYWPGKEFESLRKENVFTWDEFLKLGQEKDRAAVEQRIRGLLPTRCASVIYTSGTTGHPKGVLLSHDNLVWTARALAQSSCEAGGNERLVSYLPLSHIVAQVTDIVMTISIGATLFFADENALQGTLILTLRDARPTFFFGVPRVYEKIEERIRVVEGKKTGMAKRISNWARRIGFEGTTDQLHGRPVGIDFALANRLYYSVIKESIGLDKCCSFLVGAAPISKSCIDFFLGLNIVVYNAYGMSECSAPTSINNNQRHNIYSAGYPVTGTDFVIKNLKGEIVPAGTQGELCFRGRNKFLGYFKNEAATKEAIDQEGFIHSGDKGYIDEHGFVFITGRFKELIITAGGENIPPSNIEQALKEKCDIISYAFVVGDARRFLSMLISLKTVIGADGHPTNQLIPDVVVFLKSIGVDATTLEDAVGNEKVQKYVQGCIDEINKHAVSRAHEVKRFRFLMKDFSIPGGELTPTLKVKRKIVLEKNRDLIESIYADPKL